MERARIELLRVGRWLAPLAVLAACGCQTVKTPEERIAASPIPRELSKMSMPEYVIEPPDLLIVEVLETLQGRPITGERLVRPDGTISLGFYGDVYVSGLTLREAKEKIIIHLRKYIQDEVLGLVEPEDPDDIDSPLVPSKTPLADNDRVIVDVSAYNSKVYYVLGDVAAPGRIPVTGNETVLDALQNAGGLTPTASFPNIRLVRPAPPGACCAQVLPVNLAAIMQAGDPTTNYQLMPGDRLYVYRDPLVRTSIFLDRLAQPFNSVLQNVLSFSFAARSLKSIDQPIFGGTTTNTQTTTRTRQPLGASPAR